MSTRMTSQNTIRKLSEMTNEADFERLAMAILREAKPEYASLLHPGVNPAGKTIKSPVDGISFVIGAQPPHMIAAHHTTCSRNDLTVFAEDGLRVVHASFDFMGRHCTTSGFRATQELPSRSCPFWDYRSSP
jgi:hypothetical protein